MRDTLLKASKDHTLQEIIGALERYSFDVTDENRLQAGVSLALDAHTSPNEREIRLSVRDRVDHLVLGYVIECKVKGSQSDLLRQIIRYMSHESVKGVIVVTAAARLAVGLPREITMCKQPKPLRVVQTWRTSL